MSCDFTVDRAGTWYGPTWNASSGVFSWVLAQIGELTEDPAVAAVLRRHVAAGDRMFFLSWYPLDQGAEIVRVITGPLRDVLGGEHEHVRTVVRELVEMAEGWDAATDVFPVYLPWRFARQDDGEAVRYRCAERPLDIVFDGVRDVELPEELGSPEIRAADDGYVVHAAGFDGAVPAAGLRLLGDPYNGPLIHRVNG